MNLPPAESDPEHRTKAAMRFAYPSGSHPLAGYTIKRGVGRGGFGEVYFAVSDAGKEVALKLIRRNLDVELRGVTQCLNLKHPNLISLYDIRTDEQEDRWVVMEYVSGESLADVIDRHPQGMPRDLVMHWFTGIAAGVAYLHDHGIVHRDLKPANIFMDEGTVKIGDYGLSKFISCSRRSGQTESVGTVHYMAPEIGNGRYGKEIDTYALGIILYEMFTGHVPFEGESVGEVLMKHLTAEPDLSMLGEPYRGIVRGAMAKDPGVRIKSVAEMLDHLPATPQAAWTPSNEASPNGRSAEAAPAVEAAAPRPAEQAGPSSEPKKFYGAFLKFGAWPADEAAPSAEPTYQTESGEKPVLAGLRGGWRDLERRFRESPLQPLLKAIVSISLIIGLLVLAPSLLGLFITAGLIYLAMRALFVKPSQTRREVAARGAAPPLPGTPDIPPAMQTPSRPVSTSRKNKRRHSRQRRLNLREQLHQHLAEKSLHERATELVGGMLVAAVVAAIVSLLVGLITSRQLSVELYVWMAIVATVASWAVMIPTRFAEGLVEDQAPLRFIQLITGAAVGILAWGIAELLMLHLPVAMDVAVDPQSSMMSSTLGMNRMYPDYRGGMVQLPLQGYVAYFAFLFVLIAWWRQAESLRPSRVSLWSVVWCSLVAWLLHFVWWFPQPTGFLLAGVIAFTVQLSSAWLPPRRRRKLAEQEV